MGGALNRKEYIWEKGPHFYCRLTRITPPPPSYLSTFLTSLFALLFSVLSGTVKTPNFVTFFEQNNFFLMKTLG
jgi:hypothetical protein